MFQRFNTIIRNIVKNNNNMQVLSLFLSFSPFLSLFLSIAPFSVEFDQRAITILLSVALCSPFTPLLFFSLLCDIMISEAGICCYRTLEYQHPGRLNHRACAPHSQPVLTFNFKDIVPVVLAYIPHLHDLVAPLPPVDGGANVSP